MIRKLMLALALLIVAAVPAHAQERDWQGHFDRGRFHRFDHRPHYYAYGYTPYGYRSPRCYWEPSHWENQVIPNAYGGYAYAPQFVQGQLICP